MRGVVHVYVYFGSSMCYKETDWKCTLWLACRYDNNVTNQWACLWCGHFDCLLRLGVNADRFWQMHVTVVHRLYLPCVYHVYTLCIPCVYLAFHCVYLVYTLHFTVYTLHFTVCMSTMCIPYISLCVLFVALLERLWPLASMLFCNGSSTYTFWKACVHLHSVYGTG